MRALWSLPLCVLMAACGPPAPDDTSTGVGFNDYENYARQRAEREAALARGPRPETIRPPNSNEAFTASINQAIDDAERGPDRAPGAPLDGTGGVALGGAGESTPDDNPTISDEQSFSAVAARETIESDAERLERLREEYEVVEPQALPQRPGDGGPNIVAFALSTTHPVGTSVYDRGRTAPARTLRACERYSSAVRAQEAFLEAGGPERDRQGMDPDGDGFACNFDPEPFRAARRGG